MFPVKNNLLMQSLLKYLFSLICDSSAVSSAVCKIIFGEMKRNSTEKSFFTAEHNKPSPWKLKGSYVIEYHSYFSLLLSLVTITHKKNLM